MSKISPLYTAVIDLLDTHHASVIKHHKTGNKVLFWIHHNAYNRNFSSEIKATLTDFFKQVIGFFTAANVKIEENEGNNYKITVTIPKDHLEKLKTLQPDENNADKAVISSMLQNVTTGLFGPDVVFKVNGSSRHVRVYSIPNASAGDYITKVFNLFSENGWNMTKVSSFAEGHEFANIHFFYKKA